MPVGSLELLLSFKIIFIYLNLGIYTMGWNKDGDGVLCIRVQVNVNMSVHTCVPCGYS